MFLARAKSSTYDVQVLRSKHKLMSESLLIQRRSKAEYEDMQFRDISQSLYELEITGLKVPNIPNIFHWFRRYAIVDLARIRDRIRRETTGAEREFFDLCFAAIIRNASNADPVPVSGLEVTSHMRRKDASGRVVDPYQLYDQVVRRSLTAVEQLQSLPAYSGDVTESARFKRLDSTRELTQLGTYDAVITSPPYHGAVDYYRRHTLEMYWLDLVQDSNERLAIRPAYYRSPWSRHKGLCGGRDSV